MWCGIMGTTIDRIIGGTGDGTRLRRGGGRITLANVRRGIFFVPLVLAAVMSVAFLPELMATLVTGFTAEGGAELGIHRLHVMGIAAVVAAFLLGLFAQVSKPKTRVASMWGAFVVIAAVTAGTLAYGVGRPEEVVPFFLVTAFALIAHPAGRGLFRRGESYSPAMLGLIAVAAVPLLAFVATQLSASTSAVDPHALDGHYVMMAGLAIAPLAYGIVAAVGFVGWRLASWFAAIPIAYYGVLSISFPAQSGSTGLWWGAAAIVWAIVFVGVAEYSRGRDDGRFRRLR